ncbi:MULTISPECIES: serine acetyltransferase [unclassified Bifidobacterium]|uniref:serine acetyltransferase n=1 Tax=unclassified Bifidobacterium TaxID=2608897 RepID=UPI002158AC64|nr:MULTISPECIES: serine acetyltransferase [unclassified Bifidobacterium]
MGVLLEQDKRRYAVEKMPRFQRLFRRCQECHFKPLQLVYRLLFRWYRQKNYIELSYKTAIGGGLYIGHPYCITINPAAVIGRNVNIHRGVVIGQENRGRRKGAPTLGNDVWVGINASIVGKIVIGDDVLIAPGSYVNCDVPSHSVVFGNPCIVKYRENATAGYLNSKVDLCNND